MDFNARIYVAGHRGLIGSAIVRQLRREGFTNLILCSHAGLDLEDSGAVAKFFSEQKPDYVFVAAAKVGGIRANAISPAEFIRRNILIQTHVIHEAYRAGVKRLLFLGSSCIYPKLAPQPMKEDCFLTGPLEPTNRAYAIAKIAGVEMCWAYNRQYGTRYLAVMPTNLYGPGDNYDLKNSHVIPALIRKMHEAKLSQAESVSIWGTGTPRREFLHGDDAANACVFMMNLPDEILGPIFANGDSAPLVNVGCGQDLTIRQLAELIAEVVGFKGRLVFDSSQPDGPPQKLLDITRLTSLGWAPRLSLREGLTQTYEDYVNVVEKHAISHSAR